MSEEDHLTLSVSVPEAIETTQYTLNSLCCEWHNCKATLNSWMSLNKHIFLQHCSIQTAYYLPQGKKLQRAKLYLCCWRQCNNQYTDLNELYQHALRDHLTQTELPCIISGCTQSVQCNYMRRHYWEQHGSPDAEDRIVLVRRSLLQHRSSPREDTVWYPSTRPPDTPLPNIPDRMLLSYEAFASVVEPGPKTHAKPPNVKASLANSIHEPRWKRENSPETDVSFELLPSTATAGQTHDAPIPPAFLSNLRRPHANDAHALAQLSVVTQTGATVIPRMPAPDPTDVWHSHLARIPSTTPRTAQAPPATEQYPPQQTTGPGAFRVQFNTAKMSNLIDGRGQFPDSSTSTTLPR